MVRQFPIISFLVFSCMNLSSNGSASDWTVQRETYGVDQRTASTQGVSGSDINVQGQYQGGVTFEYVDTPPLPRGEWAPMFLTEEELLWIKDVLSTSITTDGTDILKQIADRIRKNAKSSTCLTLHVTQEILTHLGEKVCEDFVMSREGYGFIQGLSGEHEETK